MLHECKLPKYSIVVIVYLKYYEVLAKLMFVTKNEIPVRNYDSQNEPTQPWEKKDAALTQYLTGPNTIKGLH